MSRLYDLLAKANFSPRRRHDEDNLQMQCVAWFNHAHKDIRNLLHHSPNEGLLPHGARDGAKRKAMGVRAGFPDLVLLVPRGNYPYLCIELKTAKGRQSESQRGYQKAVEQAGAMYVIVRTPDEFMVEVNSYLNHSKTMET